MGKPYEWLAIAGLTLLLAVSPRSPAAAQAADLVGAALVQGDGSLLIGTRIVRLYGIYIPPTSRTCVTILRPTRCGGRAAAALEIKIQGFVHCYKQGVYADRSISAVCFVRRTFYSPGEDLAAYLLSHGWALALPGAPFEYVALERIAESRGFGVWGFTVDIFLSR